MGNTDDENILDDEVLDSIGYDDNDVYIMFIDENNEIIKIEK